jgi:hypothetical protein
VAGAEHADQAARHIGRVLERIDDRGDAEGHPRLAQIAIPGAQPVGFGRGQPHGHDQAVEGIIFGRAVEHGGERFLDRGGARQQRLGRGIGGVGHQEIVDEAQLAVVERGGHFLQRAEAEVFQHGHRV